MTKLFLRLRNLLNRGKYGYLAKNSLFFTISSFGSKFLSFLIIPLYTNILSTMEMGLADIVVTTSSLLVYAVTLCVGDAVFVFAMDKTYEIKPILKYGLSVVFKGILIFSGAILVLAWWNPLHWQKYCYLFLWAHLVLSALTTVITGYLRAIDRIRHVAVSGIVTTIVTIGSNIVFLLFVNLGLVGYLMSLSLGLAAGLVYLLANCDGFTLAIKGALCDKHTQREMLKYSIPLIINGVSWWINSSLDRYILIALSGVDSNGIYSVSSKIPTILSTISTIFAQAWSISAIKEFDKDDKDGFFGKAYEGYNAVLVICSSILVLLNVPLAGLLYAKDFYIAWKSSSLLIISVVFNSMAGFVGSVFGAVKNSEAYALSTIGAAAINVVLNLILIPKYKEMGAAAATAFSFFSLWIIRYLYSRRFIKWKVHMYKGLLSYCLLFTQVVLGLQDSHYIYAQCLCLVAIIILNIWQILPRFFMKRNVPDS